MSQDQEKDNSLELQKQVNNRKYNSQWKVDTIGFISKKSYQMKRQLGQGKFGFVIKAFSFDENNNVTIKIINNNYGDEYLDTQQQIKLSNIIKDQQYLIKTYDFLYNPKCQAYFIVNEFANCNLSSVTELNELTPKQVYSITKQLLEGLIELKNLCILHCNIKQENILYNKKQNKFKYANQNYSYYKKADIGQFKLIRNPESTFVNSISHHLISTLIIQKFGGDFMYVAPEFLEKEQNITNKVIQLKLGSLIAKYYYIKQKADIFSLGVTLAEVIRGERFENYELKEIKNDKLQSYLPQDSPYKEYINKILMKMVRQSKKDRLEPSQLLEILKGGFEFNEMEDLKSLSTKKVQQSKIKEIYQEVIKQELNSMHSSIKNESKLQKLEQEQKLESELITESEQNEISFEDNKNQSENDSLQSTDIKTSAQLRNNKKRRERRKRRRNNNNLGSSQIEKQQYDEEINCYNQVLKINPDNKIALYNLGNAYFDKGQYDMAINYYIQFLKINPNDEKVLNSLGNTYQEKKQYEEAINCYKKVMDVNPKKENVLNNLGLAYFYKKSYDESINCYNLVLKIYPDNQAALNNLGNTYQAKKQYDEAIKCYNLVIKINPNDENYLNNLGLAYFNKKSYDDAINCYNQALKINPNYECAVNNLFDAYFYKSKNDEGHKQ